MPLGASSFYILLVFNIVYQLVMKKYIIPILLLVGVLGAVVFKLKSNKKVVEERVYMPKDTTMATTTDQPPASVDEPARLFSGNFEPYRETKVSADVQGKITRMLVDVGSNVAAGQPIVKLDDALLQLQLKAVEVQIEGLEADIRRYTVLATAEAIQAVQLEKATLGLKSAEVQRATIKEQIAKTTLKAPFAGVVVAKLSEEGGFAAPGVPLLQIIEIGRLRFTIHVPENDLKQFKLGQSYRIVADAYPDRPVSGRVMMIGSKANVGNTFPVQFGLSNFPNHLVKAGMFGSVAL